MTPVATDPLGAMSCRQFVEIVTDYIDEARRLWTDEHLAGCDACRNYLEQMRMTIRALRDLGDESLDVAERERILAVMRAARPSSH